MSEPTAVCEPEAWSDAETPVARAKERLEQFNRAREWEQFHTPKDLAVALSVEAGELLECFLWKQGTEELQPARIEEELADVVICALNLASRLDVDMMAAVQRKIAGNAGRYPVELARGRADKYDELG